VDDRLTGKEAMKMPLSNFDREEEVRNVEYQRHKDRTEDLNRKLREGFFLEFD
jgi:hypothetical protein